jgi:hypothetical protein
MQRWVGLSVIADNLINLGKHLPANVDVKEHRHFRSPQAGSGRFNRMELA